MLGISIGSLNSKISFGKINYNNMFFKSELLLSDTSSRDCTSIISFTNTQRLIGDHATLTIKKNIKSSFQYINRLIGFNLNNPFSQREYNNYFYIGGNYDQQQNKFICSDNKSFYP